MRRLLALLFIVTLLGFGCLEDRTFPGSRAESVSNSQEVDLDSDGSYDYAVYDFAPVAVPESGLTVTRQMTVAVETSGAFSEIDPNLTDVDLLLADQSLEEFSKSRIQAETECSEQIGLASVVCSDILTCSKLCSAASVKCKRIVENDEEVIAGSMISYVQSNNRIRSLLLDARRSVVEFRTAGEEERAEFMQNIRGIITEVGSINSNPVYTLADFGLCQHNDFGVPYINEALARIGTHGAEPTGYRYRMILTVKGQGANGGGAETANLGISDRVPSSVVPQPEQISSIQTISASSEGGWALVNWTSSGAAKDGYVFEYEFRSAESPENVVSALRAPDVKVRKLNLVFLAPTNFFLTAVHGLTKDYFFAYGAALGITVAILFFIYNFFVLAFTMVSERAAGATFTTGFRKAFGRTDVKWKTDIIIALVALAGALTVPSLTAIAQPPSAPTVLGSFEVILASGAGLVVIGLSFVGFVFLYFVIDNIAKITILEKAYGMVIKQEKDMFLAKAASLKDRIKELETLIEELSKEDFEVSKEYEVLSAMKSEKIDALTKEMTARTKAVIDEDLSKVERAVSGLKERKRLTDESWAKWKESIAKGLSEQGEVYTSSLVTIPASLRNWALSRYVKEEGAEGLVFERDSIKRKKVTPEQMVQDLVQRGFIRGAVVMKDDKPIVSEFAEGGGTVMTALSMKLASYLKSLAKNLGQHEPVSFIAQGERRVIVMMKGRTVYSIVFVNRDKFKDAMEQWKAKMKLFEGG
ncbi:MAG: hypothetical protein AB1324_03730 [Candidatus Micrarchaeota archaeon]